MTVECIACNRLNLPASALARHGFGRCQIDPLLGYCDVNAPRACSTFVRAPADQVVERRAWLAKQHPTMSAADQQPTTTARP